MMRRLLPSAFTRHTAPVNSPCLRGRYRARSETEETRDHSQKCCNKYYIGGVYDRPTSFPVRVYGHQSASQFGMLTYGWIARRRQTLTLIIILAYWEERYTTWRRVDWKERVAGAEADRNGLQRECSPRKATAHPCVLVQAPALGLIRTEL